MKPAPNNKFLYFLIGLLFIGVLGLGYMTITGQGTDQPDLSIEIDENGLDVETD